MPTARTLVFAILLTTTLPAASGPTHELVTTAGATHTVELVQRHDDRVAVLHWEVVGESWNVYPRTWPLDLLERLEPVDSLTSKQIVLPPARRASNPGLWQPRMKRRIQQNLIASARDDIAEVRTTLAEATANNQRAAAIIAKSRAENARLAAELNPAAQLLEQRLFDYETELEKRSIPATAVIDGDSEAVVTIWEGTPIAAGRAYQRALEAYQALTRAIAANDERIATASQARAINDRRIATAQAELQRLEEEIADREALIAELTGTIRRLQAEADEPVTTGPDEPVELLPLVPPDEDPEPTTPAARPVDPPPPRKPVQAEVQRGGAFD